MINEGLREKVLQERWVPTLWDQVPGTKCLGPNGYGTKCLAFHRAVSFIKTISGTRYPTEANGQIWGDKAKTKNSAFRYHHLPDIG